MKRLVVLYPIGAEVEITFDQAAWHLATVVGHDHPGVWVQTADKRRWFVTNSRRIRPVSDISQSPIDHASP